MVIVVVRWYIKNDEDDNFKATWAEMHPKYKDGLFRELFSKPIDKPDPKYHTLDFESKHYTTYINVGIWRSIDDFDAAIGSLIPPREKHPSKNGKELIEVYDFEYKLRERIVMEVEKTRGGDYVLPKVDL